MTQTTSAKEMLMYQNNGKSGHIKSKKKTRRLRSKKKREKVIHTYYTCHGPLSKEQIKRKIRYSAEYTVSPEVAIILD